MAQPQPRPQTLPDELTGWNWGAFALTWIWGLAHRTYIALLVFVPVFGWLIVPIVLGVKGNAWAWENREWRSAEHFRRTQRIWGVASIFVWAGAILLGGLGAVSALYSLQRSRAFELAHAELEADPRVHDLLGRPLKLGWVSGSVSVADADTGDAQLSFPVDGPKASATAHVVALQQRGRWTIEHMDVELESGRHIVLEPKPVDTPQPLAATSTPVAAPTHVLLKRGATAVRGELTRKRVEQTLDESLARLEPCFAREPLRERVQLKIKAIIGPDGQVQTAGLDGTRGADPPYARCIANEVRQWSFPAPKSGIVILRYALTAEPS
jgi:hypothetical protein